MCRIEYVVNGKKHVFKALKPARQKELKKLLKRFSAQEFNAFIANLT